MAAPKLPTASELRVSSFVKDEFLMDITQQYPGGLIDIPLSRSENTYVQQLFHKQPLLGGPGLNRVLPPEQDLYYKKHLFFASLEEWSNGGVPPSSLDRTSLKELIDDGFSLLIFHPKNSAMSLAEIEEYLGIKGIIHPRTKRAAFVLTDILAAQ